MTTTQDTNVPPTPNPGRRALAGAAVVLAAANLTGSAFGFLRQAVIAATFGAGHATDAFFAASIVPQMFYDLTVGAAVSAALIPTFSEILASRGERELWRVVGGVLTLAWVVLAVVVAVLFLGARPLMTLILWGYRTHLHRGSFDLAVQNAHVLILTLLFLGTSAVFLSALYSLRRFTVSAFAPTLYHVGVIAGALLLARPLGILALPVGALVGSAAQALVQVPVLIRAGFRWTLSLTPSPEVRRIVRLYLPVAAGLIVSIAGQIIDIAFKSELVKGAITEMQFGTVLTQFPIGIAVAALSFAVLPSISTDAAFNRMDQFKDTLATGMKLVLFLTIPAAAGYLALATPIVSLLFEHSHFHPTAAARTAAALSGYAVQIPFVGVDQLLIFSFYARKDTLTPMLVGVVGVGIYVLSALVLMPRLQILGLALANTLQNSLHALILLALLFLTVGGFRGRHVLGSVVRSLAASVVMAFIARGLADLVARHVDLHHLSGQLADALVPIAAGAAVYVAAAALLGSAELRLTVRLLARRRLA